MSAGLLRTSFRAADGDEFTVSHGRENGTRWTSMEHTECLHRGRCPWDGLPEFVRLPNPSAATVSARVLQAVGRDRLDMYEPLAAEGVIKSKRNPMLGIDAVRVLRQPQKVASEAQVARGARSRDADTALMVAVLATTGARCAEAAGLRREDVDADGAGITVLGKGGKRRWVPVQDARVGRALLARPSGYVWPGRFGGHVHEATLRRKVRESTGVPPHALRRRFASQAYNGTGDLLALQMLLGHASPATTELYVRLDRDRLRAAGDAAALPWAA